MPASLPGMSITKAAELMQTQDKIIKSFPEVESLRQGRPCQYRHRPGADRDVRDGHQPQAATEWRPGMTTDKLISEMDKALQFPGVANAWTMPIKAHRHAVHRHPHADRHQGLRQGSR
jgi:Cu(I)/Ag(I) efflux system membrane protein CusA/SilA